MNEQEKAALVEFCNIVVSDIKCDEVAHKDDVVMNTLKVFEIALASLTAEPVSYADQQAFRNFKNEVATKEWMWAKPDAGLSPLFTKPPAPEQEQFTKEELDLFRQWYNAVADINHKYLNRKDALIFEKIMAMLEAPEITIGVDLASGPDSTVITHYRAPTGWKLVPVEPTSEMQTAGGIAVKCETTAINKLWTGNAVYKAMLAAAPEPEGL